MTESFADRAIRTDIEMSVVARDGIHLLFSEKDQAGNAVPAYTSNFLLSATDALSFASLLADLAMEVETGLKAPAALKQELIERHRSTLTNRIAVVLNSTREKKTVSNKGLAKQLVEIALKEVFSQ